MNPSTLPPTPPYQGGPPQPLQYALTPKRRFRDGLLGWLLFIGLAIMLVVMVRNRANPPSTDIPLSEFHRLLRQGVVESVTIEDGEVRGKFVQQVTLPSVSSKPVIHFRAALPQNMGSNWGFVQWVMDNSNGATVHADKGGSLLANIVVPLIPWVLIFGFIWFFVFRQLRGQAAKTQQPLPVVVVNPHTGGPTPPPGAPPQPPAA